MAALLLAMLYCFPLQESHIAHHIEAFSYNTTEHSGGVELDKKQLVALVIEPTLKKIGLHSQGAVDLLVMIAAHESKNGHYIAQVRGPAKGIYQMEPATHDDILRWLAVKKPEVYRSIAAIVSGEPTADKMVTNLEYSTAMARAFFLRFPEPIPTDAVTQSTYAKKRWNTYQGKATPTDYLLAYNNWK